MNDRLMIVADMEHFKAFRVIERDRATVSERKRNRSSGQETGMHGTKLEVLTHFENIAPHKKNRDIVSDKSGRFSNRGNTGALNFHSGEDHNFALEERRRVLNTISNHINKLLTDNHAGKWYFAAPSEINGKIIDKVDKRHRNKLIRNIELDLTGASKKRLIESIAKA